MISTAVRRFAWLALIFGLVSAGIAARVPDDSKDIIRFLDPLWGKSADEFPKAAKLKAIDFKTDATPVPATGKTVLLPTEATKARWTPASLASQLLSFNFDPKLGLVEVSGSLKGSADDFAALVKEMNARYGQYATHTSALEVHTYGWVFPKATLSISSDSGVPVGFRIESNP
jgi:hypothetical protein